MFWFMSCYGYERDIYSSRNDSNCTSVASPCISGTLFALFFYTVYALDKQLLW